MRLALFYGLLAAPWPGLREVYSSVYGATANAVFGSFGPHGYVRFWPSSGGREQMDTEIFIGNKQTRASRIAQHSARLTGYLPTAEILALILATPIPWSRRWKALLCGLLLTQGLIALRVIIVLLYGFSGDHPCALYAPGPFWGEVLAKAHKIGVVGVNFTFVAPILIYIPVTFRRSDFQRWAALGDERKRKSKQPER